MRFRYGIEGADPSTTLIVDGTASGFANLSHWPGNTTPPALKHDLSTGIALAYSALPDVDRLALFGPVETVANTHFDTDGVLSVLSLLRPDVALPRRDALLAAAATGDFCVFHGEQALATDLAISALPDHEASPALADLPPDATADSRYEAAYLWAVAHAEQLVDDPFAFAVLFADRHAQVLHDIDLVTRSEGVAVESHQDSDLAVVTSAHELSAMALHGAAGDHNRLLLVQPAAHGWHYRFCYRDESWFELVSRRVAPRVPLEAVARALDAAESRATSRSDRARWWCGTLDAPVPELAYGDPANPRSGFFLDPLAVPDASSALAPEFVIATLAEHLRLDGVSAA